MIYAIKTVNFRRPAVDVSHDLLWCNVQRVHVFLPAIYQKLVYAQSVARGF